MTKYTKSCSSITKVADRWNKLPEMVPNCVPRPLRFSSLYMIKQIKMGNHKQNYCIPVTTMTLHTHTYTSQLGTYSCSFIHPVYSFLPSHSIFIFL